MAIAAAPSALWCGAFAAAARRRMRAALHRGFCGALPAGAVGAIKERLISAIGGVCIAEGARIV